MTPPTRIVSADCRPLDVRMRKAFGIAGGAQTAAMNVLVEIELASGVRGWGEGAPFPAFNGETQETTLAACRSATPHLVGGDVDRLRTVANRVREHARAGGVISSAAICAVETALVDAFCRAHAVSMTSYFGGAATSLLTDVTITTGTVEEARAEATAFSAFGRLKIKVGGGNVENDVTRILTIARARPDAELLLDANGGYCVDEALFVARELRANGVTPVLFEQPVSAATSGGVGEAYQHLAKIRRDTGLRVALDEMASAPQDLLRARDAEAADAINVKIMKSGIFSALEMVSFARALGFLPMIGGLVETRLAMGTSAAIAAGHGDFFVVDLDTPLFLAEEPFDGGYEQDGERIDLAPVREGHGCVPRPRPARSRPA